MSPSKMLETSEKIPAETAKFQPSMKKKQLQPRTSASTSGGALSLPTIVVVSVLVSFLSTGMTALLQSGLKHSWDISTMIDHIYSIASQPQDNHTIVDTSASAEFTTPEEFLKNYKCQHSYTVKILHRDPFVAWIDDFLQPGEGEYLKYIGMPKMQRSSVAESPDNYYAKSQARTSSSAFLEKSQDAVVKCIEERASNVTGVPMDYCEPLQVLRYMKDEEYKPHHDYFPRENLKDFWSDKAGQRVATLLAYITGEEDGLEGGETGFPRFNVFVKPKRNACLMWYNTKLNEDGTEIEDARTLHGGYPVKGDGEKWAINIWQRKKFSGWDSGVSPPEIRA